MSKQRSLRKSRPAFDDADDEDEGGSLGVPPASVRAAQQKRDKERKQPDKKALLSFEEDAGDGGDAGAGAPQRPPGKGRASLRMPAPAGGPAAAAPANTQVAGAGEYTAERLQELQRGTLRPPGSKPAAADGAFKLSGSFRASAPAKDDRFAHSVQAAGVLEPGAMPLPPPPRPPPTTPAHLSAAPGQRAAPAAAAAAAAAASEDDDEEGDLPDDQMIRWAKAKREQLRTGRLAPDYIPTASMPGRGRAASSGAQAPLEGLHAGGGGGGPAGSGSDGEREPEERSRMQFVGKPLGRKAAMAAAAEVRLWRLRRRTRSMMIRKLTPAPALLPFPSRACADGRRGRGGGRLGGRADPQGHGRRRRALPPPRPACRRRRRRRRCRRRRWL